MTVNFPSTDGEPTDGSFKYVYNGIVYSWDGQKWTGEVTDNGDSERVGTLQEVTNLGNTTSNNIAITPNEGVTNTVFLSSAGKVAARPLSGTSNVWEGLDGSNNVTSSISSDGSINAATTSDNQTGLKFIPDNSGHSLLQVQGSGSTNFAYAVYDGDNNTYPFTASHNGSITAASSKFIVSPGGQIDNYDYIASRRFATYSGLSNELNGANYSFLAWNKDDTTDIKFGVGLNGSITAAGGATISGKIEGGELLTCNDEGIKSNTQDVFISYQSDGITPGVSIKGGGSIITAGEVKVGPSSANVGDNAGATIIQNGAVNVMNTTSDNTVLFSGYGAGVQKFKVTSNGDVTVNGNADDGNAFGITLKSAGSIAACRASGNTSVFSGYTEGNNVPQISLYANGNAVFKGTVEGTNITNFKTNLKTAITSATDLASVKTAILDALEQL